MSNSKGLALGSSCDDISDKQEVPEAQGEEGFRFQQKSYQIEGTALCIQKRDWVEGLLD